MLSYIFFPVLQVLLFALLGAGMRLLGTQNRVLVIASIALALLLSWMLLPLVPVPLALALMIVGFSLGLALAHRERFLNAIVRILIADVLLLSLSQLIAVSGIDHRIPPPAFLINLDLVYSRFTEILVGSIITAAAFVLLLRRRILRPPAHNQHVAGAVVATYLIQQVIHLEHPELGYRLFPSGETVKYTNANTSSAVNPSALGLALPDEGILIPQYVSILSYGGIFWTILLLLIVGLSLVFGVALARRVASANPRQPATQLVTHGALYFSLYHVVLMSFLLSDYDALNGVMMLLLAAITISFGLVLGRSLSRAATAYRSAA